MSFEQKFVTGEVLQQVSQGVRDKIKGEIIDNLKSTDVDKPLSANQGKILNDAKLDKAGGIIDGNLTVTGNLQQAGNDVWHAGNFDPSEYSMISHTHDNRYYTESEIDSKLSTKLDKSAKAIAASTADKLSNEQKINISGAVTGTATFDGSAPITISTTLSSVDSSKLTGTIDIARLPHGALERLVVVTDDAERLKLTKDRVQEGDTVKVEDTGKMYFVVDEDQLSSEEGYVEYSVGRAASVDWSGITSKPDLALKSDLTPLATKEELKGKEDTISKKSGFNLDKSDSIDSISSETLATSAAVKKAYDKGVEGLNKASAIEQQISSKLDKGGYTGTANDLKGLIDGKLGKSEKATSATTADSCSGNSATATRLLNPRTINGVSFDGTGNITIADNTKLPTSGGTISGSLTVTGQLVSNNEVTAYSDIRLKENIEPIENALEKVLELNGYTYKMKGNNERSCGVIAQEVEKVLPEVIRKTDNGYLSVAYANMVGLLIEAIKEQQKQINELRGVK